MDYKITNYDVATEQVCMTQTAELPIDADFTVPDYSGEIKKVLKCEVTPYISSKQVSGNALIIEGEATIKIIYADPEGNIYTAQQEVPFKRTFEAGRLIDGGYGDVRTEAIVHSCRAVTERKFSIRASVKMDATVTVIEKCEIISDIDSPCFEQLNGEAAATTPLGTCQKMLIIDEELNLPDSLPAASRIIRSSATATVTDCKIITGKIIIKGNLNLLVLYCSVENELKKHTVNIPFNQIIDMVGISELCECEASATVCGLSISSRTAEDGECRSFMLVCKVEITASARCSSNIPVLYDIYSTMYPTTPHINDVRFTKIIKQIKESFLCKKALTLPGGGVGKILDLWCKISSCNARCDGNNLLISGALTACVLYCDSDGETGFFERIIDFEYPLTIEGEVNSPFCRPDIKILMCDFTVGNSGEPELKVELMIAATVYDSNTFALITSIDIDENSPKESGASLVAYFADKGENIWEISKSFSANRSELLEINHLTDDTVQNPKMLIIPLM